MTVVRYENTTHMSQAIAHDTTAYLSGQVSRVPAGDVFGQTKAVLRQIDGLLLHSGSSKERLLSATVQLVDITSYGEMIRAWEEWVPHNQGPALITLEARLIDPEYLVGISVIAARFHHG